VDVSSYELEVIDLAPKIRIQRMVVVDPEMVVDIYPRALDVRQNAIHVEHD
jgi:hypothetical protein